jgi:glutathione S-transferase
MDLKQRTMALTESVKNRRIEDRNDRMERDIEHLRVENQALKEEIDRDRDRLSKVLGSLESTTAKAGRKPHRVRRLFTLAAAAGGAYVVGAKAGRERYEQIREWWSQMRDRSPASDAREAGQEWVDKAGSAVEDAGVRASEAIQSASQKATDKIREKTAQPGESDSS